MLNKIIRQTKRQKRIRAKISGTKERPRLSVFRSNRYIYAQLIDDTQGKTMAAASSLSDNKKRTKVDKARDVGKKLAENAKKRKISRVVFDRRGYKYHGIVKSVAEGAREGGMEF